MKNNMKIEGNIYCAGVYYIETLEGKVLYVGSGLELNDCMSRHLYYMKRGLYEGTNKAALQEEYDKGNLVFKVVLCGDRLDDEELSIAEQQHIKLNKDTICNKQTTVKRHSSNKNKVSTLRRRKANLGKNNPNCKYDEKIIAEILWLKMNGYKPKEIEEMYEDIKANYISTIGVTKWIHIEAVKPDFIEEDIKEKEIVTSANVQSLNNSVIAITV